MSTDLIGIRAWVVVQLALRGITAHLVRSVVSAVVIGLATLTVVGTSGRTEAARRALLDHLEDPQARLVRVADPERSGALTSVGIARLASIDSVEWVVGLSDAGPLARNVALGGVIQGFTAPAVGSRRFFGDLFGGPLVHANRGRVPAAGEALAGTKAASEMRLVDGTGTVDDEASGLVAVVGTFDAAPPVNSLESYVLVQSGSEESISELLLLVKSSPEVEPLVQRLPGLLGSGSEHLAIERAAELLSIRASLAREVGVLDTAVLIGSLSTSVLLIGAIQFGVIEQRRREFGIRRSQGATRSTIASLVVVESTVLAIMGTLLGGVAGTALVALTTGRLADPELTAAIAGLVGLAGVTGSVVPAIVAGLREPLDVLKSI